ncbi:MAG: sulfite exporter TauE/SafE family protein [Thermodesulfobacteriota bacterium]
MPVDLPLASLAASGGVIFFAYFIRGIAGFGSALIAVPLLTLLGLDFTLLVPLICLLDFSASISQGVKDRCQIRYSDLWPLLPFTLVGVVTGVYLLANLDHRLMGLALALFIITFAIYSLLPLPQYYGNRGWAGPAGFLGGMVGAVFGTGGPFYVIYFRLRGLDKGQFRATISLNFVIDGSLRLIFFMVGGLLAGQVFLTFLILLPLMAGGLYLGRRVHVRISQQGFVWLVSAILLLSGLALLLRSGGLRIVAGLL